eukprot:gene58166-biopygen117091
MSHCQYCAGIMDTFGDHALACQGGGDRTVRHNALRNICFRLCHAAGQCPEVEKVGLLKPRPTIGTVEEDGKSRGGSRGPDGRRPADVYLPRFRLGNPAALDFAVTSGLRVGFLDECAADGSAATTTYARYKRGYLDTASHCLEEGIDFIPMIMEAHGGSWGEDARNLFHELSKSAARLTGDSPPEKLEQYLQSISVTLHRANARAVLRRAPARLGF